jgi:hypothetical protein
VLDPAEAAKLAKLRHVSDQMPGITRHKARNGFDYRHPGGELVRDIDTLKRIRSLVIPPAWNAAWICPYPNGHIQAVGRDKRGRKQYRYHPRWREVRDESKYGKMLIFGRVLPAIRERAEADLRRRGLSRERVLAAVVRLMEMTLFRIGNTEYAKTNKSYGLTTLRDKHVAIDRKSHPSELSGEARPPPLNRYQRPPTDPHCQRLPRPARLRAFPIPRRKRKPPYDWFRGRQRLLAPDQRRRDYRQGFSNLGCHQSRGFGAAGIRTFRYRGKEEAGGGAGDREGGQALG